MKTDDLTVIISVVTPVHNAARYIARCIESLKAQTFREMEFIFVDDGSTDGSMEPVCRWASSDPRVRILKNDVNLGEGASRNRGIEAARGQYVNTIDPDDFLAPDYYSLLYARAAETSADIIKGTRIRISEETRREIPPRSALNDEIQAELAAGRPLYLPLRYEHTTLLFRRSLFGPDTLYGAASHACDTTFLLWLSAKEESFVTEDRAVYFYVQRKDSATSEFSLRRSRNELISLREQIDYLLQRVPLDVYALTYCARNIRNYAGNFCRARGAGKISQKEAALFIRDLKA